jgi:hypothetical protein
MKPWVYAQNTWRDDAIRCGWDANEEERVAKEVLEGVSKP